MYIPGTADNEQLIGTDGNDHLDGGAGEDTLQGGLGDDYYIVNSIGDQVIELANQGFDSVVASVDYTLSDNVENLFLTGNATVGTGNSADNFLVANQSLASTLYGNDGNDVIIGGAGDDTLYGDAGNDHLNGGAGADSLVGGTGDDYYVVDNIGDQVVEASGGGFDSVVSIANYTLSDNVENLFLGGDGTAGTGNNGDNYMVANQSLASTLNGLDGNDYLIGGAGNDTINGGAGNDYLDGPGGNDSLVGGSGNDYYVVDSLSSNPYVYSDPSYSSSDQVVEAADGGIDSVYVLSNNNSSDGWWSGSNNMLPTNVENVYLGGSATVAVAADYYTYGYAAGTDNYMAANPTLDSQLYAAEGNDTLIGGAGNDYLWGKGNGVAYYYGGSVIGDNDIIIGGAGNDYLYGDDPIYYDMSSFRSNDTLIGGADNDYLYGGVGNDYLDGGTGDDTLYGDSYYSYSDYGNDTLTGGTGNDTFAFENYAYFYGYDQASFADRGVSIITDFTSGQDQIQLFGFDGLTPDSFAFASVTSDQEAATNGATIVYNSTNGNLFYNQDGMTDGFGSGGLFASLTSNPTLTVSDFVVG